MSTDPRPRPVRRTRTVVHRAATRIGLMRFLRRALAVLFGVMTYTFLLNVPHPPSTALGIAYAVSALCLAVAAWRLFMATMQ